MLDLIARFDAVIKDQWEPHAAPTSESVEEIARKLAVQLPPALLEFARHSKSFSSFFLSIGPDYDSYSHIINKNNYWRNPEENIPLPAHLVMFTDGFMDDDFWCFDLDATSGQEYKIQYWSPHVDPADIPKPYDNFQEFIAASVAWYEGAQS